MLRKLRVALAAIFFISITLLFLDFTGTIHCWLGWTACIQFLPALLALNVAVVAGLLLLTLVAGRVYCSVICPLGVMQDIIAWFGGRGKKRRFRFSYSPARNWWRYAIFAIFVCAAVAGIGSLMALLAPYRSYGRIVTNIFEPIYRWGNNLLAYFAARADSYAFYSVDVWLRSLPTFIIAAATFAILFVLAWRNGRTYCNTICPVGTLLGFVSRFSLFGVRIDTTKCVSCGICSRKCKAACIDGKKTHTVDHSRCVACFNCIDACSHGAVKYAFRYRKPATAPADTSDAPDKGRRAFVTATAIAAATAAVRAQEKKVDGGLAEIENKKVPGRHTPIVPPGAVSLHHLAQHCTGCQLCVSECPSGVLRPSGNILSLMQPVSEYERGYCHPGCTRCSEVCPAGAILPVTAAEKSSIRIGHAVWVKENCLPYTDGISCGNCARHCPSGAILMVPKDASDAESPRIPVVNEERCIGCGACENLCPARPFSAIYVEGHSVHSKF